MTDAPKRSTHVWAENDFAFLGGPREIHLRAEDYDEGVSIRHAMTADEAQAFGEHLIELASTFRELAAPDPEKDEL